MRRLGVFGIEEIDGIEGSLALPSPVSRYKIIILVYFMRNMVGLTLCTQSKTMIFLVILTIWIALSVLVIGLCFAARLGDQAQHEPSSGHEERRANTSRVNRFRPSSRPASR